MERDPVSLDPYEAHTQGFTVDDWWCPSARSLRDSVFIFTNASVSGDKPQGQWEGFL